MTKMKPEDVMMAMELFVQRNLMPNVDIDGTVSVENAERWFLHLLKEHLAPYVSTLLREKDARIKELEEAQGAEFTCFVGDPHKVDRCPYGDELARLQKEVAEKDAEIERLTVNMNAYGLTAKNLAEEFEDYRADVQMEIADARAEAITEFEERLIKYYNALKCGLVAYHIREVAKELKEASNA